MHHRRMDRFVPRDDESGVMELWSVIANEVKPSIPAHHSRMDRFVPRDDESGVMAR